jgi:hypothetical protein
MNRAYVVPRAGLLKAADRKEIEAFQKSVAKWITTKVILKNCFDSFSDFIPKGR